MKRIALLITGLALILLAFAVPTVRATQDNPAPAPHKMCAMANHDGAAAKDCCKHEAQSDKKCDCCANGCACCQGGACSCEPGTCACCENGKCNHGQCAKGDCCKHQHDDTKK